MLSRTERHSRFDLGESLIELLVALMILSVATVAIVTGITTSIKVSDQNRREATATATVHDYAEAVEALVVAGGYVSGPGPYVPTLSIPPGFSTSLSKQCWTGAGWATCTSSNDIGVQQITLQVTSNDNSASEKVVVVVRKPCAIGQPVCS